MWKAVLVVAAVLPGCGSPSTPASAPAPTTTTAPSKPTAESRDLPEYPGSATAGVTTDTDGFLVEIRISTDPVEKVHAFYRGPALVGLDPVGGELTVESPLRVIDHGAPREFAISVYPDQGVTMIKVTTRGLRAVAKPQ